VDALREVGILAREDPRQRSGKRFLVPDRSSAYWKLCEELLTEARRRSS
jgi:hypothetical protein